MTKLSDGRSCSSDGPECPNCGFTFTPDESYYYQPTYEKDECQECGCKFTVEIHHSVEWECTPVEPAHASGQSEAGKS